MQGLAGLLGGARVQAVPISALHGDNVVERPERAPWYQDRTVLEALEQAPTSTFTALGTGGFRLPVQAVRPRGDGSVHITGMLSGGELRSGDEVVVLPEGRRTTVTSVATLSETVMAARPPLSISLTLADSRGLERGDLIAAASDPPPVSREQLTTVCWFAERPLRLAQRFRIKHTTQVTGGEVLAIESRLDLDRLRLTPASELAANDIGVVRWRLDVPIVADRYQQSRVTGSLFVIDPETNVTVAAAMVGAPPLR